MTERESQNFISQVLKGFWPDWMPSDTEYALWCRKLKGYDYNKSERALGEWIAEQTINYKRPSIGKILQGLSARKAYIRAGRPEPVKVFELFDQDNPDRRQAFFVGSESQLKHRPVQSYEAEADKKRQSFNSLYGGQWLVIQDWRKYFETEGVM